MEKILGLVPNVYYDIIARVVPGALLTACIVWSDQAYWAPATNYGQGVLVPLGLAIAYAIGFLLDTYAGIVFRALNRVLLPLLHRVVSSGVWKQDVWNAARTATPARGPTLSKMIAEGNMLRAFTAGWVVLWIFDLWPASNVDVLGNALITGGLFIAHYRKEYLARRDVLLWGTDPGSLNQS